MPDDSLLAILDALASDIRDVLDRADTSQRHTDDLLVTAATMLHAAYGHVIGIPQEVWDDWLKRLIPDRSERGRRSLYLIGWEKDTSARARALGARVSRRGCQEIERLRRDLIAGARPDPNAIVEKDRLAARKETRGPVYVFTGDLEQFARAIVTDLSPQRAAEFLEAVRRYVELKRRAVEAIGPPRRSDD